MSFVSVNGNKVEPGAFVMVNDVTEGEPDWQDDQVKRHYEEHEKLGLRQLVGLPLKVLSISPPFLAVQQPGCHLMSGRACLPLDTRRVVIEIPARPYVESFFGPQPLPDEQKP